MNLSPHFTLEELTITSVPGMSDRNYLLATQEPIITNLRRVAHEILEPIRELFDTPIVIHSGFRCEEVNKAVGGSPVSQHMSGCAVDFDLQGLERRRMDVLHRLTTWGWEVPRRPRFRQLLMEKNTLHISLPNGHFDGEVAFYDVESKTKKILRNGVA